MYVITIPTTVYTLEMLLQVYWYITTFLLILCLTLWPHSFFSYQSLTCSIPRCIHQINFYYSPWSPREFDLYLSYHEINQLVPKAIKTSLHLCSYVPYRLHHGSTSWAIAFTSTHDNTRMLPAELLGSQGVDFFLILFRLFRSFSLNGTTQ